MSRIESGTGEGAIGVLRKGKHNTTEGRKIEPHSSEVHRIAVEAKARIYWLLVDRIIRRKVEQPQNLWAARRHLEQKKSLYIITNHQSMLDSGLAMSVVERECRGVIQHRIQPTSTKFFDVDELYDNLELTAAEREAVIAGKAVQKKDAKPEVGEALRIIARNQNLELVPVVQHYRLGTGTFLRVNMRINETSFNRIEEVLKMEQAVGGISPEGTRSSSGLLLEGQPGSKRPFRDPVVRERTLILPIGLVGTRDIHNEENGWGNI